MKNRNLITTGLVVVLFGVTFLSVMISMWFILLGICIVIGYGYYLFNHNDEDDTETKEAPNADGVDMDWETEVTSVQAYTMLMEVNYKLRVKGHNLSQEHVDTIEELIDDLRNLILMMDNSTSVLKWKVNQICVDFLPKLLNRYLMAPSNSRDEIMATTITEIQGKVSEIEDVINNNNEAEFEHYAETLQKIMKL
jgi:hypothetical protein